MAMKEYKTVDEYIANFPPEVQKNLTRIRQTIQKAAPNATEKISYGIPTFYLHSNLVHFAAYDSHYALYPGAAPIVEFADELKSYNTAKGTIRFPIDKPLPFGLIEKITLFRVQQNESKKK